MSPADVALFAVILALAGNQAVMRVDAAVRSGPVFWSLVLLDLVVGSALILFGLPGFDHVPAVSYVVGLLFFVHAAQNQVVRRRMLADEVDEARAARVAALRAQVREDEAP